MNATAAKYIVPWLSKVESISGAASEIAFIVMGQSEKASQSISKQLEYYKTELANSHPANANLMSGYIEELKRCANAQKLPGFF